MEEVIQLLCLKSDQLKEQDMAPVKAVTVTVAVVSPVAKVSERHFTPTAPAGEGAGDGAASGRHRCR